VHKYFFKKVWIFQIVCWPKEDLKAMIELIPNAEMEFVGIGIGPFYIGVFYGGVKK
jgi:hypothetical protein